MLFCVAFTWVYMYPTQIKHHTERELYANYSSCAKQFCLITSTTTPQLGFACELLTLLSYEHHLLIVKNYVALAEYPLASRRVGI